MSYLNLIIRTGVDVFRPYLDKLEEDVPQGYIKHITSTTTMDVYNSLHVRPMFSKHVIVYASIVDDDVKYIMNILDLSKLDWIQLILTVSNHIIFDNLKYDSRFKFFKFLDCYKVNKDLLEKYIQYSLIKNGCNPKYITKTSITRIRRRARYRTYVLDSILPILAKTNLSQRVVFSYIAPYTGVTLSNIGKRFFEPDKKIYIAQFLNRYRNYVSTIFKNVRSYVDDWLNLYNEYASGRLSEETALEWLNTYGSKFKIHYSYEITAWLDSFNRYSFDFMIFVFTELQAASHDNNNLQLLTLYKIFRMVNSIG